MEEAETIPRVPENVPGDFYVEAGRCLFCCLSHAEASDLMNDSDEDFFECYFRRQPVTASEIDRAMAATDVCCVNALRYGGVDQAIIRRLHELGKGECCDYPLLGREPE